MAKIALGTVQFGLDYGVSNICGKVQHDQIAAILAYASANGIDMLDTAQGYGESESVLGGFDLSKFKIVTKIIGSGRLEDSLLRLKTQSVYALMFHREDELTPASWARFEGYKAQGLVSKIGVSVYSPERLSAIMAEYPIDIVQFPCNILDRRFLPLLPELKSKGVEVHTRSAFLQGLLLMNPAKADKYFDPVKPILSAIPEPKLDYALGFVKAQPGIDDIVVGVTCLKDLQQIVDAYNKKTVKQDYDKFRIVDERFINPSKWELNK